jgi:hypothetical protein
MNRTHVVLALLLTSTGLTGPLWGGEGATEPVVVMGTSVGDPVVPFRFYGDLRDLPPAESWAPGDPVDINPRRWIGPEIDVPFTPAKPDPLLGRQRSVSGAGPAFTEVASVDGVASASCCPPDPTMDVGPDYIVQAVNASTVSIWDKDDLSTPVATFALDSLGSGDCANGIGDPIVLYDPLANRWLLTEFTSPGNNDLCVYVSMTSDPVAGGWCQYEYQSTSFPDYPHYGVWTDAYWVTTNQGARVYAFDRANMISCDTARPVQLATAPSLPGLGFEAFMPSDIDGDTAPPAGSKAMMIRHRDTELGNQGPSLPTQDVIEFWSAEVDFDTADSLMLTKQPDILVSEFDSNLCPPIGVFSCVPQQGGSDLDPLLEVMMYRTAYRNFGTHESIVGVLQTDVGDFEDHSGERWLEFRREGGDWSLHQEGTYSPDADHRFMGTIAQDQSGNILLAYAASSASIYPGIRYTGRLASDPLGVMTLPEQTLVAGQQSNPSNRYGDYSQMNVDPEDDCTFWFTVEYRGSTAAEQSRIGAVRFDQCGEGSDEIFADGFETGDRSEWSNAAP